MQTLTSKFSSLLLFLVFTLSCSAQSLSGGVTLGGSFRHGEPPSLISPTPPMGWNSWLYLSETYGYPPATNAAPTESYIKTQADALVSSGLLALGYNLVSIDGGWQQRTGNTLQAIPAQFPDGMAAVASYIHADGELLGLYGTPTNTANACLPYPGNAGYEQGDAATMVGWGVDYFKSDYCEMQNQFPTDAQQEQAFQTMANAFVANNRNVQFVVNAYYGTSYVPTSTSLLWYRNIGATVLRIGYDNNATNTQNGWWYYKAQNSPWSSYAPYQSKGYWLDPDNLMMQLKEGGPSQSTANVVVGDAEGRAQFQWYTVMAFPLVFGIPVASLDTNNLATLSNAAAVAVDQDSLGVMGSLVATTTCGSTVCQVWARTLSTGKIAVLFLNYDTTAAHTVAVTWTQLGISGSHSIYDIFANVSEGTSTSGYTSVSLSPFQTTTAGQWCSQMVEIQ